MRRAGLKTVGTLLANGRLVLGKEKPMTRVNDANPNPSDATQKTDDSKKQREMEQVQEEVAQDRASEGGYQ